MNANGFPYNGEYNNDYVNGQFCPKDIVGCTREFANEFAFLSLARQFCCNNGMPEAAQAKAMTRAAIDGNLTTLNLGGTRQTASSLALPSLAQGFKPNDEYEKMQFYYHPDHLGSSSYITNLDGEVSQHIEYVPFGEVFIDELEPWRKSATEGKANSNNTWNTPYLFNCCANERQIKPRFIRPSAANSRYTNAKELDEETGLYYYGARYYEPRISLWMSTDPLATYSPFSNENYIDGEHNGGVYNNMNLGIYSYCYQNPIKLSDPDGRQVVAVHGTNSDNGTWKQRQQITNYAGKKFGNTRGDFGFNWSGGNSVSSRTRAAQELVARIKRNRHKYSPSEPITIVGHSHGGNVGIEAINMMVNMPEFDNIKINLLTINTPVRDDYQLSSKATKRVTHVNVYDPLDPVQNRGGNKWDVPFVGEVGPAGRLYRNAENIQVNDPQGLIHHWEMDPASNQCYPVGGDWHNSHNRTEDWVNK